MMMAYNNTNLNNGPFSSGGEADSFDPFGSHQQVEGKLDMSNFTTGHQNNNALAVHLQSRLLQQQQQQQQQFAAANSNNNNCHTNLAQQPNFLFGNNNNNKMQPTMNNNFQAQQQLSNNNCTANQHNLNAGPTAVGYMNQLLVHNNNNNNNNNNMSNNNMMNCNSSNNNSMNINMQQFQPTTLMNAMDNVQQQHQPFSFGGANTGIFATNSQIMAPQQQLSNGIPAFITTTSTPTINADPASAIPMLLSAAAATSAVSANNINIDASLTEPTPFFEEEKKSNEVLSNITITIPPQVTQCGTAPSASANTMATMCLPSRSINKTKRLLPVGFEPQDRHIICGNKRKFFESKGNMMFRKVCDIFIHDYVSAPTKIEKSAVVSQVMNILRQDCLDGVCFVSPQAGRWYAVSERTAREKVGTYLRDCLSGHYLSSAKNKIARRKMTKKELAAADASSTSSSTIVPVMTTPAPAPAMVTTNTTPTPTAVNTTTNDQDDDSFGSFYDVDNLAPVPL